VVQVWEHGIPEYAQRGCWRRAMRSRTARSSSTSPRRCRFGCPQAVLGLGCPQAVLGLGIGERLEGGVDRLEILGSDKAKTAKEEGGA
jgi:hypothetical protein